MPVEEDGRHVRQVAVEEALLSLSKNLQSNHLYKHKCGDQVAMKRIRESTGKSKLLKTIYLTSSSANLLEPSQLVQRDLEQ
eukprot:4571377-Pleurochrysis_carterae.AAC.1